MNLMKSLVLGSAAALLAGAGAQAADLPIKAKAVEYVRVCSLYGAGFYYIPGTDTCIKLGGYIRADVLANTNSDAKGAEAGAAGAQNRYTNAFTWRSREDFNVDTRTATDYGVVRTYADVVFTWTSDTYAGNGAGGSVYNSIGGAAGTNNASSGLVSAGSLGVYYAFIQFAGFTFGKAVSQFAAPWTGYPGNNFDSLVGGINTVTGVNQFTYTADFGQGITAAISAQDPTQYTQAGLANMSTASASGIIGGSYGTSDYGGTAFPDVIGMVRVDQAWGLAQVMAAAHDNHAAYYGGGAFAGTELAGHPDDKWGWAAGAALSIKNIPTGPGDTINIQGVYTNGASRYNFSDIGDNNFALYGGGAGLGGLAFASAPDTVFVNGGQQQTISTWGFRGAYTHNWDAYWNTSLYGAYAGVSYSSGAKSIMCGAGGIVSTALGAGLTSCNPDFNIAQLGVITRWTPVKNLTFSADVLATNIDQKYAGTVALPAVAGVGKSAGTYQLKDETSVSVLFRAQRNF